MKLKWYLKKKVCHRQSNGKRINVSALSPPTSATKSFSLVHAPSIPLIYKNCSSINEECFHSSVPLHMLLLVGKSLLFLTFLTWFNPCSFIKNWFWSHFLGEHSLIIPDCFSCSSDVFPASYVLSSTQAISNFFIIVYLCFFLWKLKVP